MANDPRKGILQKYGLQLLGLVFYFLYLIGTFLPDPWWGTHFLAFLPPFWRYVLLLISGGLIVYSFLKPEGLNKEEKWGKLANKKDKWIIGGLTIFMGLMMYHFPIAEDHYGDAYKLVDQLDIKIRKIPDGANEAFFSFSLSPWAGHSSVLALVTYIAYFLGISYGKAFIWLDTVCGMLFILSWLRFLSYYIENNIWKIILAITGLTAPFMLIYFGHIESYAPVFLLFIVWLMGSLIYLQNKQTSLLWGLAGLLIICMKVHPVAFLFAPAWALLVIHHYFEGKKWSNSLTSSKGILSFILLPIFVIGAILYFFVFEDYKDPRDLISTQEAYERLFLPLFSPEPPLDKYNLLSFNHIFDYVNELFIWSPIALFLIILLLFKVKGENLRKSLAIRISGLTLILFGSLFFVINPLLSMQMDWDLMAIPAPAFLIFLVVLVKELKPRQLANQALPIGIALSLLTIPNFVIHQNAQMHAKRLEKIGVRMYHTYYEWSNKVIEYSLYLPSPTRKEYEIQKQRIITELQPHAQPRIDFEFARLLIKEAAYYLRTEKDAEKALTYLNQAFYHFPLEKNGLLYSMEANFILKRFNQAFIFSKGLIEIKYPSEPKAIAIAVQCALEAELYEDALSLSEEYINRWDDKEILRTVYQRLRTGEEIEQLKFLFAQPDE